MQDFIDNFTVGWWTFVAVAGWVVATIGFLWGIAGRNDFIDWMPEWLIGTLAAEFGYIFTLPLLNVIADKNQFGSVVGAAREFAMFSERPWYGVGGYQFLIFILIALAGLGVRWYRNRY